MKKFFSPFNLVMSSRRGILTTTGQSHNKRLNTYASKRNVRELIPEKKTKTTSTLVTSSFQPMSSDGQTKVTNACLSDSSCSGDSVSESKPEASQVTTCQEY